MGLLFTDERGRCINVAYEDIRELVNAEKEAEEKRAEAALEAKRIVAQGRAGAEEERRRILASAAERAEAVKRAAQREAERVAAEHTAHYLSESEAIKRTAALHYEKAVRIITDKILTYEFRYV